MTDSPVEPWRQWFAACESGGAVDVALRDLYARLDADIAARSPTCWLSGKCCHFDSYGHLLYVTGLEIAWLLAGGIPAAGAPGSSATSMSPPASVDGCPFQQNKLCGVHAMRPLGCRIFYCDPAAQGWQNEVYERYLAELRALHQRLDLPYQYMEWRAGLTQALAAGKIHP